MAAINPARPPVAITLGFSSITWSIIPASFDFYWQPPAYAYDPVKAKQLLVCNEEGQYIGDAILFGLGEEKVSLVGGPVAANWVPQVGSWRVTLTYPALNAARRVVFLVAGAEKAAVAAAIIGKRSSSAFPAGRVRPRQGSLLWLLDEEAGANL